jgi:ParB family chromosome partitioning protein
MAKIVSTSARDIALDKLIASDLNVRRIKAGVSVEDLAEDIARRGLLQSLNVRPEVDGEGAETGRFSVTAGGRRLAALKLLVKQSRLAKNAPVPCIVKVDGIEEEDSFAENRAVAKPIAIILTFAPDFCGGFRSPSCPDGPS